MHLASDEARHKLPEKERAVLKAALARNGIEDPAATLKSVRAAALALELASPELAANVRLSRLLQLRSTLAQKDEQQRAVRQGVEPRTESAS